MALYSTALSRILPAGTDAYLALLIVAPELDGLHEEEASYPGYARILHTAWATHQDMVDGSWYLSNTGSVVFPAVSGKYVYAVNWGIYPTSVGGSLLASGPLLDAFGTPSPAYLQGGDQARFLDDTLRIRSGV